MTKSNLLHIADRVLNRPLMILPDKLALISSVLEGRIGIDTTELEVLPGLRDMRPEPDASRFEGVVAQTDPNDPKSRKPYRTTASGVALIPVLGSLVNRGAWIGASSGMTSYEGLKHQISRAAADPDVTSIVLDFDSPGGEAVGAFEVADIVRDASTKKPVVAVVNGMAASAAYAIASAASKIITTSSGISGSIGVVMLHADYSHRLHEAGVKPTLIHAGKHKVDGNPYEPLTDAVKGELKTEIDSFYDIFVGQVARGRKGMTPDSIRATEARTFIGQAAVDAGLADEIGSFETAIAGLSKAPRAIQTGNRRTTMELTQADLDKARAEGVTEGKTIAAKEASASGAKAERDRIAGILSCDEAKGREASAQHLALNTDMTIDAAKGALAGIAAVAPTDPKKEQASHGGRGPLGIVVEGSGAPAAPGAALSPEEVAASINKKLAVRK